MWDNYDYTYSSTDWIPEWDPGIPEDYECPVCGGPKARWERICMECYWLEKSEKWEDEE